ncbi:BMP family ABC transporter substrate-binding protein [Ruminococcus sp.]|uniref:BMP family ABC transporter substrate-binding protein n=1 Tax=Ruminococcus sp. TaxID=41978 RepID=UPI00261F672A|nr:BMP family ABC transporter substrate-binding protein [Ruminococcus sp.]MDD6989421.1 BMP family ABC transporter substrate-binding protein [Ruminococcus sp.]MDY6201625.1 BMP family ABC transporter substrate-binding protein [Ruminococcus sp.]
MFKKLLSITLAALMVLSFAAVFTGCGSNNSSSNSSGESSGKSADSLKFGFIYLHDENSTYDNNFLTAAKEACEKMGVEMINKTNIDESDACKEAALDLVDQGCDIIFADSFGHEDFMIEAAKANPDVQFLHATGTKAHTEKLDNFHNAFASIYEGRYLAGVAAGMKINEMIEEGKFTKDEAKMGYVGAHPYAEVKSGYTSFYLGAKSVCPTVTMEVKFTGSWYDETLEKEAANKLISDGCVLISQHADSMGAPTACESAGVPNVSYNGSTVSACPNTFIVSSKINWAPYFEYAIKCVQEGKAIDTDWTGTIATGSVELTEVNEKAAAKGTQEAIDAAKADLESGKINVFDTANFTIKGEALTSYMADVDTDAEFKGDTEVIKDGVFEESKYRSAPYFDVDIDGISVIE